jgi:transposase
MKSKQIKNLTTRVEEMEGARRASGISSTAAPNPEVPEKAIRRSYTAEYKRRILKEAEGCKEKGQIGTLLRREGLYPSNLTAWRHQAERGTLDALSSKKRGPKARKHDPSIRRIAEQEKEIQKLQAKLKKAELIIDAQKKIAEFFQLYRDQKEEEN